MNNSERVGIESVLSYFNAQFGKAAQPPSDHAINQIIILKGKVLERIGENLRIGLLHPDGTLTDERVDLDSWEVSLLNNANPQGEATRGDSGDTQ